MKNIIKTLKSEEGVSLFISILVLSAVFSIGVGMAGIMLTEIEVAREIGNFIPSIYASDAGIEKALYEIRKDGQFRSGCINSGDCTVSGSLNNGATYEATIYNNGGDGGNCSSPTACIKSVGSVGESNRALEVTF